MMPVIWVCFGQNPPSGHTDRSQSHWLSPAHSHVDMHVLYVSTSDKVCSFSQMLQAHVGENISGYRTQQEECEWEGGQDWQVDTHSWSEAPAHARGCSVIQPTTGDNRRSKHSTRHCWAFHLKVRFKYCTGWLAPLLMLQSSSVPLSECICPQH